MITFQFVVYGTSNKLNAYMCSKGTYLWLKNYMPRKGVKLEMANFRILLLLLVLVKLAYLTDRSTDKHETWLRDEAL